MVKHSLVTIGQLILVTIIILFVSYRVALLMDWVPEGFSPSGLAKEEYKAFKENLHQDAYSDDATAPISLFVLQSINKIEAAYNSEAKSESDQEKTDVRCGENSIYRYFMTMSGSDTNGQCTPEVRKIKPAPVTPAAPSPAPNQYNNQAPVVPESTDQSMPPVGVPVTAPPVTVDPVAPNQ